VGERKHGIRGGSSRCCATGRREGRRGEKGEGREQGIAGTRPRGGGQKRGESWEGGRRGVHREMGRNSGETGG
jgi:hypothetical protein